MISRSVLKKRVIGFRVTFPVSQLGSLGCVHSLLNSWILVPPIGQRLHAYASRDTCGALRQSFFQSSAEPVNYFVSVLRWPSRLRFTQISILHCVIY